MECSMFDVHLIYPSYIKREEEKIRFLYVGDNDISDKTPREGASLEFMGAVVVVVAVAMVVVTVT